MWNLQNDGRVLDFQRARGDVCLPRTTNPKRASLKAAGLAGWLGGFQEFYVLCLSRVKKKKKMQSHTWTTAKKRTHQDKGATSSLMPLLLRLAAFHTETEEWGGVTISCHFCATRRSREGRRTTRAGSRNTAHAFAGWCTLAVETLLKY